jgi:hypothetical protein
MRVISSLVPAALIALSIGGFFTLEKAQAQFLGIEGFDPFNRERLSNNGVNFWVPCNGRGRAVVTVVQSATDGNEIEYSAEFDSKCSKNLRIELEKDTNGGRIVSVYSLEKNTKPVASYKANWSEKFVIEGRKRRKLTNFFRILPSGETEYKQIGYVLPSLKKSGKIVE